MIISTETVNINTCKKLTDVPFRWVNFFQLYNVAITKDTYIKHLKILEILTGFDNEQTSQLLIVNTNIHTKFFKKKISKFNWVTTKVAQILTSRSSFSDFKSIVITY